MVAGYLPEPFQEIEKHLKKKNKTSFSKMPFCKMACSK
jgi:hypothetical protein